MRPKNSRNSLVWSDSSAKRDHISSRSRENSRIMHLSPMPQRKSCEQKWKNSASQKMSSKSSKKKRVISDNKSFSTSNKTPENSGVLFLIGLFYFCFESIEAFLEFEILLLQGFDFTILSIVFVCKFLDSLDDNCRNIWILHSLHSLSRSMYKFRENFFNFLGYKTDIPMFIIFPLKCNSSKLKNLFERIFDSFYIFLQFYIRCYIKHCSIDSTIARGTISYICRPSIEPI